jgi:hypothetical protein
MGLTWPETHAGLWAYVDVRNKAKGQEGRPFEISCTLLRGGNAGTVELATRSVTSKGIIHSGKTKRVKVVLPKVTVPGDHVVSCTVDSSGKIEEVDEGNNTVSASFQISKRSPDAHAIELVDFDKKWTAGSHGHKTVRFKAFQPGGRDYPANVTGGNAKLGWQADCHVMPMPWVKVRKVGNMTQLPFGSMPGHKKKVSASAWLDPVNLSGKPKLEDMPSVLPMACTVTVGAFVVLPTKPGQSDLRPVSKFWSTGRVIQLANPESKQPLSGDRLPTGAIEAATQNQVRGWACDPDTPNQSIEVELSFGKQRHYKTKVRADLASASSVNSKCGGGSKHTFSFKPTKAILDHLRGLPSHERVVYAKGFNSNDLGKDADLGSPKPISVSAAAIDLVASAVHPRDAKNFGLTHPEWKGPVSAYVEVENRSPNKLDDKVKVTCALHLGTNEKGTKLGSVSVMASPPGPKATKAILVKLPEITKLAKHFVRCEVDSDDRFEETDETNNIVTAQFRASTRGGNAYELKLTDFDANWTKGPMGHRTIKFKAHRVGGSDQPTKSFSSQHKLGWQADCKVIPMPWVTVAEVGNMTHRPFGPLPGRHDKLAASAWLDPVKLSGHPQLKDMGKTIPMVCKIQTGIFIPMPTKPGQTDLRPIKVFWEGSQVIQLDNPEK